MHISMLNIIDTVSYLIEPRDRDLFFFTSFVPFYSRSLCLAVSLVCSTSFNSLANISRHFHNVNVKQYFYREHQNDGKRSQKFPP